MVPYFLKISLIVLGYYTPTDGRTGRFSEAFSMDVKSAQPLMSDIVSNLTFILLMWTFGRAPNNDSKWQIGFNSVAFLYRFEILWMLADPSLDQLPKIFTPTVAKRKYMRVASTLSQLLSITLGYLTTGNAF